MSQLHIKTNNYNTPIIKENDFNELMISNDEDKIFDEFIKYLPLVCRSILTQERFVATLDLPVIITDIKRLFSLNLKIFDVFMFSDDFKESLDQEAKDELENVYDKTNYIVNNIKNESFNKEEMLESIKVVQQFWDKKFGEQKALGETLKETNDVLEDDFKKINNSLKIKEISDFGKKNMTIRSSEVTAKAEEYLEVLKKMILDYPKDTVEKVNQNITNDREFYSKSENIKKENTDELTIYNIITCSMIMLAIK